MKKVLSMVLCICMILSSVAVLGAVDESYKSVLEIVKSRIPNTDDFDDFSAEQSVSNGVKTYQFSWYNEETGASMNVECFENGIITRYNCYGKEEYSEKKAFSDLSKDEALKRAKNAFAKLNPDIINKVKIEHGNQNKQLWETNQYFTVSRIENGIEVYGDSGNFEMDINAENITWFYINWSNYESFENPENSISVEDAKKIFADKLGLCLTYKAEYKDGKIAPYLVYTLKESADKYVDFQGNIVECDPYAIYRTGGGGTLKNTAMASMDAAVEFSGAEILEMEKLDFLLAQSEVEELLKDNEIINISDVELASSSVRRDYYNKEKYYYNLRYTSDTARVTASVDAQTGEIISYSRYIYAENKNTISEEEAQQKATQAVKQLCISNFDEYELIVSDGYSRQYYRIADGIRFPHDSISVSINENTGEISSYSKTYSNVEFPSKENVISLNMANKCAYELFSYGLKYIPSYNQETKQNDIKLVFAFTSADFDIDPFTGEKYKYGNEEQLFEYEDIENHYARKYIEELASYGIGLGDKAFNPDNAIAQKDYISLLVQVFYRYYSAMPKTDEEVEDVYQTAIRQGVISKDEVDYNALVTRSKAAEYLVNALGYKEIAKAEKIFYCPFTDVAENKGSITILYGLGIVSGDETGNFNPNQNISRADAMIMLYNYLSK